MLQQIVTTCENHKEQRVRRGQDQRFVWEDRNRLPVNSCVHFTHPFLAVIVTFRKETELQDRKELFTRWELLFANWNKSTVYLKNKAEEWGSGRGSWWCRWWSSGKRNCSSPCRQVGPDTETESQEDTVSWQSKASSESLMNGTKILASRLWIVGEIARSFWDLNKQMGRQRSASISHRCVVCVFVSIECVFCEEGLGMDREKWVEEHEAGSTSPSTLFSRVATVSTGIDRQTYTHDEFQKKRQEYND